MAKTIVGIKYKSKYSEEFAGRTYNYFCEIPVQVGDIVEAPVGDGISIAMVCEIDVSESIIDERIMLLLKTITKLFESPGEEEEL